MTDSRSYNRFAIIVMVIFAVFSLVHAFIAYKYQVGVERVVNGEAWAATELVGTEKAYNTLLIASWLVRILCIAALSAWTYHAYTNLKKMGYSMRHATFWTIGGWLIPFANLVLPFSMISELSHKYSKLSGFSEGLTKARLPSESAVKSLGIMFIAVYGMGSILYYWGGKNMEAPGGNIFRINWHTYMSGITLIQWANVLWAIAGALAAWFFVRILPLQNEVLVMRREGQLVTEYKGKLKLPVLRVIKDREAYEKMKAEERAEKLQDMTPDSKGESFFESDTPPAPDAPTDTSPESDPFDTF